MSARYLASVGTVMVEVVCEPGGDMGNPSLAAKEAIASEPRDGREHFRVLLLNARHASLGWQTVSIGCLTSSVAHPREVFRAAIVAGATGMVLTHNHPSGDPEPSAEDLALTRRLAAAGAIVGIEVHDHIVTGGGRYVSLKERGAL